MLYNLGMKAASGSFNLLSRFIKPCVLNVLPLAGVKEQVDSRIVLMSNAALKPQIGDQFSRVAL
jgi:hypothetical protein